MGAGFGTNANALAAGMRDAFGNDDLTGLIFLRLAANPDDVAPDGTIGARVIKLMQWAQRESRERDLVDAIAAERGGDRDLQAAIAAVRAHLDRAAAATWYESPDPVETCFIRTDWPFLNRTALRQGLRAILNQQGPRTLVVRGSSGSGRSYSSHLVAHVAERERHAVFPLDVQTMLEPGFAPEELARVIAYTIGRGEAVEYMPQLQSTPARHNLELVGWLASEVDRTRTTWWILLDGLDKVDLRPATIDFVVHLMRAAETSERHLRVVLLGCGDVLPPDLEDLAYREDIEGIQRRTIEDFFVRLAQHKHIDATPAQIEASVEKVLEGAPEDGPERLRAISVRLRAVARVFAAAPVAPGG